MSNVPPVRRLRTSSRPRTSSRAARTSKFLGPWQGAFLIVGISGVVTRGFTGNIDLSDTQQDVADTLSRQGIIGVVSLVLFAVTAFLAMRAIKEIDRIVSGS